MSGVMTSLFTDTWNLVVSASILSAGLIIGSLILVTGLGRIQRYRSEMRLKELMLAKGVAPRDIERVLRACSTPVTHDAPPSSVTP